MDQSGEQKLRPDSETPRVNTTRRESAGSLRTQRQDPQSAHWNLDAVMTWAYCCVGQQLSSTRTGFVGSAMEDAQIKKVTECVFLKRTEYSSSRRGILMLPDLQDVKQTVWVTDR